VPEKAALTAFQTKAARAEARARLRQFFQSLPVDRDQWLAKVQEVADDRTRIPGLNRPVRTFSEDLGRVIEIKALRKTAIVNAYNHFARLRELTAGDRKPPWLEELVTLIARPPMRDLDLPLALMIALRETGAKGYDRMNYRSSQNRVLDSFHDGGLDFLWRNRWRYRDDNIVPLDWLSDLKRGADGSAGYVAKRGMAWHFARLSMTRRVVLRRTETHYRIGQTPADPASLYEATPPLARRIWFALGFQAYNGRDKNLARTPPKGLGVITVLRAHAVLRLPLSAISEVHKVAALLRQNHSLERDFDPDVKDVLLGSRAARLDAIRFLSKLAQFHRFRLAAKAAIMAQALDELQSSARQAD
jgi:hypothetical protein